MRIGTYILTGYLGSGKTTLLQKLLGYLQSQSNRVVVMVNEMGEEDVDGEQLEGFGFPVKKMLDGCICCSIRGELTTGLREIVTNLQPEQIIIETTGAADPIDIVDALTYPELYDQIELKGIISVVDTSRYLSLTSRFHSTSMLVKTIRNQIKYADLLVLNKIDLVNEETLAKVKTKITELNPKAPLYTTVHSEMDWPVLLSVKRNAVQIEKSDQAVSPPVQTSIGRFSPLNKLKQTLGRKSSSFYHSIESFSYHFAGPVDPLEFENFLYDLPKNVYRAKGFVSFINQPGVVSFQHTDNQVMLIPYDNFSPKQIAVFIGEQLDKEQIIGKLEKCYSRL